MKKALLTALLALGAGVAMAQVEINIDLDDRGIEISPMLNGIFYEDINHSADGGLYAELIRNRSFEEFELQRRRRRPGDEENDEPWREERQNNIQSWREVGECTLELTTEGLLNDKQGHALVADVEEAGAGVQNEGFWGINAVNGTQYRLSLWVKVMEGNPAKLTASLISEEGENVGTVDITDHLGNEWQKVETTLIATGNDPQAHFELTADSPCKLALDVVSLFPPTYKNRPNGLRPQLMEMLAAMRPKFLRFPGGCNVEGMRIPESAFRWERTVGPIEERPGHPGVKWGYWISDGMGFHEFLQMAEDLGAKPLYVVNVGIWHEGYTPVAELDTTWVQECLDALEYANGDLNTKYGRMRAENGHPEPFNIEYVEIGNENANFKFKDNSDQSHHYFERYRKFYDAIKAKYPNIQCIGNVEAWSTDHPSWRSKEPVDILDEHYYRNPSWFVEAYDKYDTYSRQGPRIYVGEYAVTSQFGKVGNMNAALGEAVYMLGMENNSDLVMMNSYAPLFVNENAYNWPANMIHFDSGQAFGTPSYWVQQMFPTHLGTRLLNQRMEWSLPEPEMQTEDDKPLQVGVAAWRTKATYKDPELIVDGEQVELPDITTWSSQQVTPPQRAGGPRRIRAFQLWSTDEEEGSVTSLGFGEGLKWMCPLKINSRKYSFRVKAKKNEGSEGFLLVFNYKNERDFDWMNVGGWGNTNNSIEQSVDGGRITLTEKEVKFKVKNDRWYDVRVDVDGDNMTAYVDGKLQFSAQHRNANMRGVFSNSTLDEATNTLYIKVVNVGGEATSGTVNLENGTATTAEMLRLSGTSGQEENSMDHPLNIIPRPANVDVEAEGKRLTFDVAPFSVSIITAKLK